MSKFLCDLKNEGYARFGELDTVRGECITAKIDEWLCDGMPSDNVLRKGCSHVNPPNQQCNPPSSDEIDKKRRHDKYTTEHYNLINKYNYKSFGNEDLKEEIKCCLQEEIMKICNDIRSVSQFPDLSHDDTPQIAIRFSKGHTGYLHLDGAGGKDDSAMVPAFIVGFYLHDSEDSFGCMTVKCDNEKTLHKILSTTVTNPSEIIKKDDLEKINGNIDHININKIHEVTVPINKNDIIIFRGDCLHNFTLPKPGSVRYAIYYRIYANPDNGGLTYKQFESLSALACPKQDSQGPTGP